MQAQCEHVDYSSPHMVGTQKAVYFTHPSPTAMVLVLHSDLFISLDTSGNARNLD